MEAEAEVVSFVVSTGGGVLSYFQSNLGVAATKMGEDSYSLRLKGGFYAKGLSEAEAIRVLVLGEKAHGE